MAQCSGFPRRRRVREHEPREIVAPGPLQELDAGLPQRGNTPDGGPQLINTEEILESVKEWNRLRKVKIHTIGIGEADVTFMTKLATMNDGTFTPVK